MPSDQYPTFTSEQQRPALVPDSAIATPRVCLDCGDFGLIIPATDLVSLTSPKQMARREGDFSETCGSVLFQQHHYLIFCLNNSLQLQQEIPDSHTTLALLQSEDYRFGISGQSLTKLESEPSARFAVPPSMNSRRQPFNEFTVLNNRAFGLTSAAQLLDLFQGLLKTSGVCIQPQNSIHSNFRRGASI